MLEHLMQNTWQIPLIFWLVTSLITDYTDGVEDFETVTDQSCKGRMYADMCAVYTHLVQMLLFLVTCRQI